MSEITPEREEYLRFKPSWHVNDVDQATELWAYIDLLRAELERTRVRMHAEANAADAATTHDSEATAELDRLRAQVATRDAEIDDRLTEIAAMREEAAEFQRLHSESLAAARAEVERQRKELESIREMTGVIQHTRYEDCIGCGCMALTAEEAVATALAAYRSGNPAVAPDGEVERLQARVEATTCCELCDEWDDLTKEPPSWVVCWRCWNKQGQKQGRLRGDLQRRIADLEAGLRAVGRSKIAVYGKNPGIDDERELCWCHCLGTRCVGEPRCIEAATLLFPQPPVTSGDGEKGVGQ